MKKAILGLCIVMVFCAINAQDVKRTFGVGLQSSFPTFGISVKYAVSEKSVVQATLAPFGVTSGGESV
jgi:hypothetical protein